tara:strand:+ start:4233 stop:4397 length:165 start_codon:yes stop_codon:yes gene_type:complete
LLSKNINADEALLCNHVIAPENSVISKKFWLIKKTIFDNFSSVTGRDKRKKKIK